MSNAKRYWADNSQIADMKIAKYVDQVFERLAEYHTADKRDKAIGLTDDVAKIKASWAREFCLMTPEMVVRGGKKIRDQAFCPSLARFTQLCKPSAEDAYAEAQLGMQARSRGEFGVWACPAVYFSAVEFGSTDLREKDWLRAAARFSKIFERAIERQERGELELIPAPVPAERRVENKPITRDSVKVGALVERAFAAVNSNPKGWAFTPKSFTATREMLARAKSGFLGLDVVKHNFELGTIVEDGDWYKPVGYIQRGELCLVGVV